MRCWKTSLLYTSEHARKWSADLGIANSALGIVSFLVLEALGGSITLSYGSINALWAIRSRFRSRDFQRHPNLLLRIQHG